MKREAGLGYCLGALLCTGLPLAQEGSASGGGAQQTSVATSVPSTVAVASAVATATASGEKTADQLHEEGVLLLRERRIDAAIERLRAATEMDATSALYITDLGYAHLLKEHYGEAETAFKRAIELDPNRPHAYGHLVESIIRAPHRWEKRQELFAVLERALSAGLPQDTRLKIEIARIRAERSYGLVERAREHIEQALHQPKLPRAVAKQLSDLKTDLKQDERAQALRDWPEPNVESKDRERFAQCASLAQARKPNEGLACVDPLVLAFPAWRAPRQLRAELLDQQGHYDEAVKDLTILTRLAPSEATHFRKLGMLLAEHGGLLELERADEALRIAGAMEPEWTELEAMRQRLAARRYASNARQRAPKATAPEPSANAQRLYEEAETSLDEDPNSRASAVALLEQALRESPNHVEAATLLFSLTRRVPDKTVEKLWNDGPRLFALYRECASVDPPLPGAVLERWLNRAIELGHVEGRLARALNLKHQGNRAAAEIELSNYLALVDNRAEIDAVQVLRAELLEKPKTGQALARDALLNARLRLRADDLDGALRLLEAPCHPRMDAEHLLWLGIAYERQRNFESALNCYETELTQVTSSGYRKQIQRRMARLLARADTKLLVGAGGARLLELTSTEPAAFWALARRALELGKAADAATYVERYLAQADPNDRFVSDAKATRQRLAAAEQARVARERRMRSVTAWATAAGLALVLLIVYFVRYRGSTVARAIRRRPRIYPEVVRVIGELRHDVIKHRTSALGLLAQTPDALPKIRSTILEPTPTSVVVAAAYTRLVAAARAEGVRLRRLAREPIFGRLAADLRAVEGALREGTDVVELLRLDERLRTLHRDGLQQLLSSGPRCHLDAAQIQAWIAALQAELAGKKQVWTVPALQMSDLSLALPVDSAAVFQIFANLLRNAQAALRDCEDPKVLVRVVRQTDTTGQHWIKLQIGDNATGEISSEDVESQIPGRGLGIVRDTARDWNGHVVIAPENEPYRKTVGVEFAI